MLTIKSERSYHRHLNGSVILYFVFQGMGAIFNGVFLKSRERLKKMLPKVSVIRYLCMFTVPTSSPVILMSSEFELFKSICSVPCVR